MARHASTYRGARRMRAKALRLIWHRLPRDRGGRQTIVKLALA